MSLLLILAALAGLWLAASRPGFAALIAAPALLACVVAGLTLPDIDQPLPLDHRSALTHGIFPAVVLAALRWARAAAAGLALGIGLHLAADLFPNAMIGYATVAVPFSGRLDAGQSYLWLGGNALACAVVGLWLLHRSVPHTRLKVGALIGTALIGLWYLPRVDGGWPALLLLAGAGWLMLRQRLPADAADATSRP